MEKLEDYESQDIPEPKEEVNLSPKGIASIQGNPTEEVPEKSEVDATPKNDNDFLRVDKLEKEPISGEQNLQEFTNPATNDTGNHKVGFADELAKNWHYQEGPNDCGVYSQAGILEADGKPFEIEKFRNQAIADGSFAPQDGMKANQLGDLLEENGVEVNRFDGASFQDLEQELQMGKGVVTSVDTEPLWGSPGGHALWITGMEIDKDGKPVNITANDSGLSDGQAVKYPYEDFKEAWLAYHNQMVSTKNPLKTLS